MHYADFSSSVVGDDFGLKTFRDEVFEVHTMEEGEDWSAPNIFWMNQVSRSTKLLQYKTQSTITRS